MTLAHPGAADQEVVSIVGDVDPRAVVALARHHRVVVPLHDRIASIDGIDGPVVDALAAAVMVVHARQATLRRTLDIAMQALELPALVVKGHVLANWYDDPSSREFNDVDIIVAPADFRRTLDALSAAGITSAITNWHGLLAHAVAEVPLRDKSSVVDLHWHAVAMGSARRHLRLPTAEFLRRSVTTRVGEREVHTLDPVDTLLHLCVNAGLDGGRRLRSLLDVDVVVRSGRIDFGELAARAHRAGAGRLCAAMLQRAAGMLATPVPPGLLMDLTPGRSWLITNRIADSTAFGRRRGPTSLGSGLLMSSGRDTAFATWIAFARSAGRAVAVRCGMPELTDRGGELDWQRLPDDGSVDAHRLNFLDWVTTIAVSEDR